VSLPSEKRNVWLTNLTALVICGGHLVVLSFRLLSGRATTDISLVLIINSVVILFPIFLNSLGYTNVSRILLSWLAAILIFDDTIFLLSHSVTPESSTYVGFRFFLMVFACTPFLIFNATEKGYLALGLVISLSGLVFYDPIIAFFGFGYEAVGLNEPSYYYNTFRSVVAFLVLAVSFFYLKNTLEKGEKINERLLVELDEKNKMIKRQADQDVHELNVQLTNSNYQLKERVKELTGLYRVGQALRDDGRTVEDVVKDIVSSLPSAWQFPEITAARINIGTVEIRDPNFAHAVSLQTAAINLPDNRKGFVEVAYLEQKPAQFEGPFLKEERDLLNLVAEMLGIYLAKREESEALKRSEANLNATINNTHVLIWSVDRNFDLLAYNTPFYSYIKNQYGVEISIGSKILPDISGGQRAVWDSRYQRCLEGENVKLEEHRAGIDFAYSLSPIIKSDGSVTGVSVFAEDVTEQRRIQKQQALYTTIVDTSDDAIFIRTDDGKIASWNQGAENIFGYTPAEIIGESIDTLIPANLRQEKDRILEGIKKGETIHHLETVRIRKNGQPVNVSMTISPLNDSSGRRIGTSSIVRDISERIAASEKLAANERRFRALIEHSTDGISLVDSDFRHIYQSPGAERILGYTLAERREGGHNNLSIVHPDDKELLANARNKTIATPGISSEFQYRMRHKRGHYIWVEGVMNNMLNDPGVNAIVVNFRDITLRKEAEERILRHKQELETEVQEQTRELVNEKNFTDSIVNSMPGIFYVIDDERFTRWNQNLEKITGYSEQEIGAMSLYDLIPDSKDFTVELDRRSSSFELSLRTKTGKLVPFYFSSILVEIDSSKLIVGTAADISALKEAQETLRLHDERMELAFSTSGNSWWDLVIPTGRVDSHPNRYLTLGYSAEDVVPTSEWWTSLIHPDDRERAVNRMNEYLQGNSFIYDEQFRVCAKQNEWKWVRVLGKVVTRDENGHPLRMIGTADNITKNKEIEQELIEARSAAEAANRTKGQFLANMSHEIRTPLNAVIGLSHLASKTKLTPKQLDYVHKIQSSSESLLGIINDILDFSKMDSGKLRLEEVQFDLEDVLHKLADVITYRAHAKGLEIVFGVDENVPVYLVGDPVRLQQILNNLCSNAVKFTEKGEVLVAARIVEEDDDEIKIEFEVRDTGIGMDEEQMRKLFQPFSQADDSISRKYGGTGLGLSIIKHLVELMRGEVWMESAPGQGSTFYFTVWFKRQSQQRKLPAPDLEFEKMKILLVDDNKSASAILRKALESFSFEVTETDSALNAIHSLMNSDPKKPFRLILMDWNMPKMDGLEAARIVKQDTLFRDIPIIMMCSSYANEELYQKVDELQLSGILIKPIKYSALYDTIVQCIHPNTGIKTTHESKTAEDAIPLEQGHVLLVEDNEINRQVATELLTGFGYSVDIAENGLKAIHKVQESGVPSRYDLVLMDLQMPVLGGYNATIEIRKMQQYASLPIIAMTADAMEGVREKCVEVGMMDFISKPINPSLMLEVIKKWSTRADAGQLHVPAPSEAQPNLRIPEISGIDIEDGLSRVNGNVGLYMDLLGRFFTDYKSFAEDLVGMVRSGDQQSARRSIHTLKGTSASLGMLSLYQVVVDTENKLKGVGLANEMEELLAPLRKEVQVIQDSLSKSLVQASSAINRMSLAEARPLLTQLDTLLKKGDSESISIMKKIGDVKGHQKKIEQIRIAIQQYDFDKARSILQTIITG
jgi:two-component system sensor histidine kinase/response regulator